jgi:N-acetylglutamate synthase-like GNAT family acetyltransferase
MEVEITEVLFGSELYEQSKQFRDHVLRRPIGLTLSAQDIAGEERQIHIVAINAEDREIVGCVLLKPLTSDLIKLRQMAVGPQAQGAGLGRKLVRFAETLAQARGFKEIELNARVSAQVFYEKLGYEVCGEPFVEVTLPTILMTRTLR